MPSTEQKYELHLWPPVMVAIPASCSQAHELTDIPFSLSCYPTNLDFSPVWILNTLTTMHTALLSNCDVSNEKLSSHLSSIGNPVWHQPSLLVTVGRDLFVFLINVEHSDQCWTCWSTLNFLTNVEHSDQHWTGRIVSSGLLCWLVVAASYQVIRWREGRHMKHAGSCTKLSAVSNCPQCQIFRSVKLSAG